MDPILVVGGGLAGLAAALALPGPIVLVDPRPREAGAKDRRSAAILQPGRAFLERLGVWDGLASATPLERLRVLDLDTGRDATFDSADLEGGGPFGWNVPNDAMRAALIEALEARGDVELAFGTSLSSLTPRSEESVAHLSDGRRLRPPGPHFFLYAENEIDFMWRVFQSLYGFYSHVTADAIIHTFCGQTVALGDKIPFK